MATENVSSDGSVPSTSAVIIYCSNVDESDKEPPPKKHKNTNENESLEEKLHEILRCAVCLDLPNSCAHQCYNGHVMCSQCMNHLLADSHLKGIPASCPSCRATISKDSCVRNLVVEKAISELPVKCENCKVKLPRAMMDQHERQICPERNTKCRYQRIGCPWAGPYKNAAKHEEKCAQPLKTGKEIKESIEPSIIPNRFVATTMFSKKYLFEYLSCRKIHYNDLKLVGPFQSTEKCIQFESVRVTAFGLTWELHAQVNDREHYPFQKCQKAIVYKLTLRDKIEKPINLNFTMTNSPNGRIHLTPKMEKFTFTNRVPETHFITLPIENALECYRILAGTIKLRLVMFCDDPEPEIQF